MTASYKGQGHECYDWYHYLWHLIAIRAIKAAPIAPGAPDAKYEILPDGWAELGLGDNELPGEGETIALIDTGVNDRHPNLAGRILPAVDFVAHPYGATFDDPPAEPPLTVPAATPDALSNIAETMTRGLESPLPASLIGAAIWTEANTIATAGGPPPPPPFSTPAAMQAVVARLRAGRGVKRRLAHAARLRYAAHGTACAGLMVGAPPAPSAPAAQQAQVQGVDPIENQQPVLCEAEDDPNAGPIPYWGVAPGAKILPIIVSAEPTAEQLIFAFLYAWEKGVSVIHFPREAPDPFRAPRLKKGYGGTRYESERAAWDLFFLLLREISKQIPVVCAAGNDGLDRLIYPASLADGVNGVVAVGAATYNAKRSSYSNYADLGGSERVTITAPSDDAEVYTRHQLRLDRESPDWRTHNRFVHPLSGGIEQVDYAPQALLTTDIPGPGGYLGGGFAALDPQGGAAEDRAALYALFGGTSGASALVAGAVALRQSKARNQTGALRNGLQIKQDLLASGTVPVGWPWLSAGSALATDKPNGEAAMSSIRQFGAGVLDLTKLL